MMRVVLLAALKATSGKEDARAALLIESQPIAVSPRSERSIPATRSEPMSYLLADIG